MINIDPNGKCVPCLVAGIAGVALLAPGCSTQSQSANPISRNIMTLGERNRILDSQVAIVGGPYDDECSKESRVRCGKRCNSGKSAPHGIGTLLDGGIVVSHNHYRGSNGASTASALDYIKNVDNHDWIEFRWRNDDTKTIHVPIDLVQGSYLNLDTVHFQLPTGCDSNHLGTLPPAPFSSWGISDANQFVSAFSNVGNSTSEKFNGASVYQIRNTGGGLGANVLNPTGYLEAQEVFVSYVFGSQPSVQGYTGIFNSNSGLGFLENAYDIEAPSTITGDSGGGAFMILDEKLFYIGAHQVASGSRLSNPPYQSSITQPMFIR